MDELKNKFMNKGVKDIYTHFSGIVTAVVEYNDGQQNALVEAYAISNTIQPVEKWISVKRLTVVSA